MKELGILGEQYTAEFLCSKKCFIDKMNYSSRYGEIDIVAHNEKYILFVEVKTRKNSIIAPPREAVNRSKQKKIILTAQIYLQNFKSNLQPRFDVSEIIITKDNKYNINYIKNAFDMGVMDDSF